MVEVLRKTLWNLHLYKIVQSSWLCRLLMDTASNFHPLVNVKEMIYIAGGFFRWQIAVACSPDITKQVGHELNCSYAGLALGEMLEGRPIALCGIFMIIVLKVSIPKMTSTPEWPKSKATYILITAYWLGGLNVIAENFCILYIPKGM